MKTASVILWDFVQQRSGIEFANYGDVASFRKEQREIANDKKDFAELFALVTRRCSNYDELIEQELTQSTGRLTMKDGKLSYCTGQYFPTEYRPAACRILVSILWNDYRDEKNADGSPVYPDGIAIRKAIRRNLSRRVGRNYFN